MYRERAPGYKFYAVGDDMIYRAERNWVISDVLSKFRAGANTTAHCVSLVIHTSVYFFLFMIYTVTNGVVTFSRVR